ncbi:DNA methyltransferase [Lactococcus petauri]|uniref:DNA methyltransferase n=1 Tax=Lactococcus petauri TaxID=1940789 RepID=UPI00177CDCCD|nr:DNA methyltransferase [Lactococcus petauri]MBD5824622.1 DNA methylase [Lactococcus petauri]
MNKLISLEEVSNALNLSRDVVIDIVKNKNIAIFNIGEEEFISESEAADIFVEKIENNNEEIIEKESGRYDSRNKLNDLTGKEWMPETKSFWYQKGLGKSHPHAQIEKQHPAPFSFQDISRLIAFFTKKGEVVLDPFSGVGSTVKAAALTERKGIGIELSPKWSELSLKRLEIEVGEGTSKHHKIITGDSRKVLKKLEKNSVDFVVTSPPYWAILNKKADHKVKKERLENDLATNYSDSDDDLGNVQEYSDFLNIMTDDIFLETGKIIKPQKYMAIIVSDFRHKSKFISFHSDLIQRLDNLNLGDGFELTLQGVKVLLQNHKSLLPYGYPFAYVENIHHQYILIFRKTKVV